jgi:hypothetical protein
MIAIVLAAAIATASPSPPPACAATPAFHALDFWIGRWRVTSGGAFAGSDVVRAVQGGCAVEEDWTDADGSHGQSLFYYNWFADTWRQVWVTDRATYRGGLKEKQLVARYPDGGVRFQGLLPGAPGSRLVLDRTTLTPLGPDRVRQVIETSVDGGTNWRVGFDAIYSRDSS